MSGTEWPIQPPADSDAGIGSMGQLKIQLIWEFAKYVSSGDMWAVLGCFPIWDILPWRDVVRGTHVWTISDPYHKR